MAIAVNRICHLIIDTTCDLPYEVVRSMDVEVLHFSYIVGGKEYLDDFWQSANPKDFYEMMKAGQRPTTAAYPLGRFIEVFTRAAQKGMPTVYLSFPAALSGSYSMACMAADKVKEDYPDFELYVVDTCLPSTAAGQLVLQAARMRDSGMSAAELSEWAQTSKYYVHGYFTLDNLEALAAGGRIPPSAAQLGSKLDIKPLLSFDLSGALSLAGMTRGRKRAIKNLADRFKANFDGDISAPVTVGSAYADKDAAYLVDLIRKDKNFSDLPVIHFQVGPVIGSHVGPGMLAIGFWGKDRREGSSIVDRIAERVRKNA